MEESWTHDIIFVLKLLKTKKERNWGNETVLLCLYQAMSFIKKIKFSSFHTGTYLYTSEPCKISDSKACKANYI